jgi:hypothetical protein
MRPAQKPGRFTLPSQHRPNRVQPLLNDRQDNQHHPRPPDPTGAPRRHLPVSVAETDPAVADQLARNCRTSPGTGHARSTCTAGSGSSRSRAGSAGWRRVSTPYGPGSAAQLMTL